MSATTTTASKEKKRRIAHIIAGLTILLHGYERWSHGHGTGYFFFVAGIIFLLIARWHHQLLHRWPYIDSLFFLIESSLSFLIAWEYFSAGKKLLPAIYAIAALLQLSAIFIFYRKKARQQPGMDH